MKRAEKLRKSHHLEEAISIYLKLIDRKPHHPQNPRILLMIGELYSYSLNQKEKGIETFRLVTARYPLTPFDLQASLQRGTLYFNAEQFEQALREYQDLLSRFRDFPQKERTRFQLAACHFKLKQFDSARKELRSILEMNLKTPLGDQILFYAGASYTQQSRFPQAIALYEGLIRNYPQSSLLLETKFLLADAFLHVGDFEKALSYSREIQGGYPNKNLVELQIQKGESQKKEAELLKAKQKVALEKRGQAKKTLTQNSRKSILLRPNPLLKKPSIDQMVDEILKEYQ